MNCQKCKQVPATQRVWSDYGSVPDIYVCSKCIYDIDNKKYQGATYL